ncbi:MAG: D-alanyl-D-alanine carboxypeptidase family protein, partial [Fimbriimonadaceae bacterium]
RLTTHDPRPSTHDPRISTLQSPTSNLQSPISNLQSPKWKYNHATGVVRIRPILCALMGLVVLPAWGKDPTKLNVSAPSAVIISAETGQVLWSKDAETPRFPASTTKIMTALLLIEHCKPDDVITAPKGITEVKGSSMHLQDGEQVTAHDMLYALLLRSANDGCVAVADHIAGSVPAFAAMMNARAKELGCAHTHFHNANGLNDPDHTICAHDLALIAREAMTYPVFREVVRQYKYKITRSINQEDTVMVSHNKWLRKDPTADGIKTGWTIPAGHCYVGSATRNGFRVITVVMHSEHWQLDHQKMLHWAYATFHPEPLTVPATLTARTLDNKTIPLTMDHPRYYVCPPGSHPAQARLELLPALTEGAGQGQIATAVKRGQIIGEFKFRSDDSAFDAPAIADADYTPPTVVKREGVPFTVPTVLLGGMLAGSAFAMRKKARRMYGGRRDPS